MKINKIALISNNFDGAMLQMTGELLKDLTVMGFQAVAFIPSENNLRMADEYKDKIITYNFGTGKISKKIHGTLPYNLLLRNVSRVIRDMKPDLVWTIDDKPFTSMLGSMLSKRFPTYMTIHDLEFHPSYNNSIRNRIYLHLWKRYKEDYIKASTGIITMSGNVFNQVQSVRKQEAQKTVCLQLGAHIPEAVPKKPVELDGSIDEKRYNLFFGRIDKYKGLDTLLDSYVKYHGNKELIIAGSGVMQNDWLARIHGDRRIHVINRYIEDGEMIWLISNANCVVLPYVEASQSGVIPIAYFYSVPVITSDVFGLTQNVVNCKTGFICRTVDDYVEAYDFLDCLDDRRIMREHIDQYYADHFDWVKNLKELIESVESSQDDKRK